MSISCSMEVVEIDDDDYCEKVDADSGDEAKVFLCNFDVNEFVNQALAELDVKTQIQDVLSSCGATLTKLETNARLNNQIFDGLDARMKRLDGYAATLNFPPNPRASFVFGKQPPNAKTPTQGLRPAGAGSGDVIPVGRVVSRPPTLPPNGTLMRKKPVEGCRVYAMKGSIYGVWQKAKVIEAKTAPPAETIYKIKYETKKNQSQNLTGKQIAFINPAEVLLPVGTRVIAQYKNEYHTNQNALYAGIVAETPTVMNSYRYLIFFDDGYAQYVAHNEIRVVCDCSQFVWEDILPGSQAFIRNYIKQYPERPMVKMQVGHDVKTEWNGKWWLAKVMVVDASLVQMYFHADKRTEWIYRGSRRLGPLYSELTSAEAMRSSGRISRRHNLDASKRKSDPYVEYTRGLDESVAQSEPDAEQAEREKKQVARKHTAPQTVAVKIKATPAYKPAVKVNRENDGTIEMRTCFRGERRLYTPHMCAPSCLNGIDENFPSFKGKNPLSIPLRCGWERQIVRHKSTCKLVVFYKGPCGRRLRNIEEVYRYLVITDSKLSIDQFTTDCEVFVCGEFVPAQVMCRMKDISFGKENVQVSGVNSLGNEFPDYVQYSTKRIPNKGVDLNLDPEFLIGCDCEDNCSDSSKCQCRQLTVEATKVLCRNQEGDSVSGYTYKRLKESIATGIYECNSRCKCSSRCLNRVVQNGLQLRLQIFKTALRGWGMRCLDDIPQGCFLCIYAGQLLNEERADEDGAQFGDEYLAELDYIEVVEKRKEGYENDVVGGTDPVGGEEAVGLNESKQSSEPMKGDSDGSNFSTEDAKNESANSSDSDFEAPSTPITHRVHGTRNKIQKLVLRREAGDQESNHSWNVLLGGEEGISDDAATTTKKDGVQEDSETKGTGDESKHLSDSDATVDKNELTASKEAKRKTDRSESITADIGSDEESSSVNKQSSQHQTDDEREGERFKSQNSFWSMPEIIEGNSTNKPPNTGSAENPKEKRSVRELFGEENCYVMDAKSLGNIGRYLNHSCSPNVFCQNVFVDTHDLRFPWVTFFALTHVRAGTELTWDYNYDVGSVPNKVLHCECKSSECRGRLL